ncbi:unnamed protein product [Protopolystoma xenopodis]|uniref:Uncharacterized protein n=1 Tax=Protopolystoma xenopodis TaxID=117903 RepID=A0A3S5CJE2_9PLAT|nr:unnamed protein product [Protopolystoma xenopodis]
MCWFRLVFKVCPCLLNRVRLNLAVKTCPKDPSLTDALADDPKRPTLRAALPVIHPSRKKPSLPPVQPFFPIFHHFSPLFHVTLFKPTSDKIVSFAQLPCFTVAMTSTARVKPTLCSTSLSFQQHQFISDDVHQGSISITMATSTNSAPASSVNTTGRNVVTLSPQL